MAEEQQNPGMEELRRRAEIHLREQLFLDEDRLEGITPEQARHLVHELQTHQIELEIQNETLRQTQKDLESTRDRFVELYDVAPVAYFTIAEKGLITEANLTAKALLNIEHGSLPGHTFAEFVFEEDQGLYYQFRKAVLKGPEKETCELRIRTADESVFYGRLEAQRATDTSFRFILSDISADREIEEKMIKLQRLHAVGELAAGVSHNLNNMLTGVLLPAQILKSKTDDPDLLLHVDDIIISGRRMADLVTQIHQAVHHNENTVLEALDLNADIMRSIELSRSRWQDEAQKKGIAIETITDLVEIQFIRGSKSALENLLLNLLLNAIDALPRGGTITVQTRPVDSGVQLTISDTGTGMDNETLRRVFEPFFTTKKTVGTGLGLSTVYRTVQHWGGTIEVESTVDIGTTFSLYLPTYSGTISAPEERDSVSPSVLSARILIADDDELITHILNRMLAGKHQIEFAKSGTEALDKFKKDTYDVVIIDLGLPELPGDKVAQYIRQLDSSVALIMVTGWTLETDDERLSLFDFYSQKPFVDLQEFKDTIDQAILLCRKLQSNESP
ncbi:MAG: two-component system cell cycle sensor histidine kinase/response regulator CckA [Planctomycetota bacterium]|jgi:two-component system cell cycle sensor histidine kinase/response regulator CckA